MKKLWATLAPSLTVKRVNSQALWEKYQRASIRMLCHHSREAKGGSVFFCLVGKSSDGHTYAASAYRAGCRVFIVEHEVDLPADALQIEVPSAREALADCAAAFYDHPERDLRLIGLTGTKGKTTTAMLIRSLLCAAGIPAGYIGTCGVDFADEHYETANSTPESVDIYRYLAMMRDAGMVACAMEISSQALWMKRVRGLSFDTTLFTNLSPDHIGGVEHPDMTHYRASKQKLFSQYPARTVIVNRDDESAAYMIEDVAAKHPTPTVISFSTAEPSEESSVVPPLWTADNVRTGRLDAAVGVYFDCRRDGVSLGEWFLPLPGEFNVQNALGALTVVCECFGVSPDVACAALETVSVPGRFEALLHPALPDTAFVIDYAHNGASLAAILDALAAYGPRRLIALFGSVGGRTYERRRELAEAAGPRCDLCILTSDNPACESPADIIRAIDEAFPQGSCPRLLIPDRAEAIRRAVELAEAGDIIVLAGKGHETYQLIGTRKIPFSEKEILAEALEARAGAGIV